MSCTEIVWNLKRLIRDGYPQGMPIRDLQPLYFKYFQRQLPTPSAIAPGCADWYQVFQKSERFKEWFRCSKKGIIKALPIPERDLKAYFRLNNHTHYISMRAEAKADGWSDISDTEDSDSSSDEDLKLAAMETVVKTKKAQKEEQDDDDDPGGDAQEQFQSSSKKQKLNYEGLDNPTHRASMSCLRHDKLTSGTERVECGKLVNGKATAIAKAKVELTKTKADDKNSTNVKQIAKMVGLSAPNYQTAGSEMQNSISEQNGLEKSKDAILKSLQIMCLPSECKICSVRHSDVQSRISHYLSTNSDHIKACRAWLNKNGVVRDLAPKWHELTWGAVWRYGRSEQANLWEQSFKNFLNQATELCKSKPQSTALTCLGGTMSSVWSGLLFPGTYASPDEPAAILREYWCACNKRDLEKNFVQELSRLFKEVPDGIIKDFKSAVGDCPVSAP